MELVVLVNENKASAAVSYICVIWGKKKKKSDIETIVRTAWKQ